jgi:hypothetical protein
MKTIPKWLQKRYREQELREEEIEREKTTLREGTWPTRREKEGLLADSAKYPDWESELIQHFRALRANGIHSAKDIAKALGRYNFRTLSGDTLGVHLVNVLREQLRREGKLETPPGATVKPLNDVEKAHSNHKTHPNYTPTPNPDIDDK